MKSKKHAKLKNKMNKAMKFLSMAALALVGAVMTGCSNDDIVDIDQPGNDNVERLTVVANLDGSTTRALDTDGKKTYNVGDKIAVVYKNNIRTVKSESAPLTEGDITGSGKSAKFTVTLVNPKKNKNVTYIYPAYMAKDDGTVNYDALYNEQDGTLETLGSKFDYCTYTGAWNEEKLPTATLANQLVICEYTLKNSDGSKEFNDKVTTMTISDGTNVYIINRTAGAGSIYVVIKPTSSANINYTATTNDGKVWTKSVTGKTYGAGEWCPLGLRMTEEQNMVAGLFSISASKKVYFSKGNLRYVSGAWSFFDTQDGYYNTYSSDAWDKFGWVGGNSGSLKDSEPGKWGVSTSTTTADYGTNASENMASDWGNVPGIGTDWRTLTKDEWVYLFTKRTASTVNDIPNARYAKAKVNNIHGVILFPDTYTHPAGVTLPNGINVATTNAGWSYNKYTDTDWDKMEAAGCVFLPAAGARNGSSVNDVDSYGLYWSSTASDANSANCVYFHAERLNAGDSSSRYYGFSVRLVRDVVAP